jgi:hypothetical protein
MSPGSDDRRLVGNMLDDIELELAAIKLSADRERLDQARPHPHRPSAPAPTDPKVIDTRGLNINKTAAPSPARGHRWRSGSRRCGPTPRSSPAAIVLSATRNCPIVPLMANACSIIIARIISPVA